MGITDFTGINWYYNREEYTTAYSYEIEQFEFKINKRGLIESEAEYQRPITVEAEMRSSENTMTMTLFGDQKLMFGSEFRNSGVTVYLHLTYWRLYLETNSWNKLEYFVETRPKWHKVRLELDDLEEVKLYIDNELKYTGTSIKNKGKLSFIAVGSPMKIKNVKIGKQISV